jgi:adhesin transport system membrane fusion protein
MNNYLKQLKQAYLARQIIWLISGLVVAVIVWASWAKLDVVVVGQGVLVPSASVQKVQSLDGGVLRKLHVAQGDIVEQGQLLATLDETRARASFAEAKAEQDTLLAKRLRLQTQLKVIAVNTVNKDYVLPTELTLQANKFANYNAEMGELERRLEKADEDIVQQKGDLAEASKNYQTFKASVKLLEQEYELMQQAVESGALSESELRKLEREKVKVQGQLEAEYIKLDRLRSMVSESEQSKDLVFDEFRRQSQSNLSDADARLARLEQLLTGLNSQLEETKMYASMAGVVKTIALPSIGGVVRPGETLLEIVPNDGVLLVEAKVKPKDIARLVVGQDAVVKFSAYDFVIYGGVKGKLIHIAPDAIIDEREGTFFLVHVAASSDSWKSEAWQDKPIISGMQAEVDILAGSKTVLQYWLKPLLRASSVAMREP